MLYKDVTHVCGSVGVAVGKPRGGPDGRAGEGLAECGAGTGEQRHGVRDEDA